MNTPKPPQDHWMYEQMPEPVSPLLRTLTWISVAVLFAAFGAGITYLIVSKNGNKNELPSSQSTANNGAVQSLISGSTPSTATSSSATTFSLSFADSVVKKLENFPVFAATIPVGWTTEQLFGPGDNQYYLPTAPRLAALRISSPDNSQTVAVSLRDSVMIDTTKAYAVDIKDLKTIDKRWVRYYDSVQKFWVYRAATSVITPTSDNATYQLLRSCTPSSVITCPVILATTSDIAYLKGDAIGGYTRGTNLTILLPDSKSNAVTTPCSSASATQQCADRNVPYLIIFTGTDTTVADIIVSKITL